MINKKSIWFLTLFSLILVLSVYYVTMPSELLLTNNSDYTSKIDEEEENNTPEHITDILKSGGEKKVLNTFSILTSEQRELNENYLTLMQENLERLQKEVEWFVEKNDYRNHDKPWGNSADSIQRGMQKCGGGYPADEVFKAKL